MYFEKSEKFCQFPQIFWVIEICYGQLMAKNINRDEPLTVDHSIRNKIGYAIEFHAKTEKFAIIKRSGGSPYVMYVSNKPEKLIKLERGTY